MHLGRSIIWSARATVLGLVLVLGTPPMAGAAPTPAARGAAALPPAETTLTAAGAGTYAGETTPLRIRLVLGDGTPVRGAAITVQRLLGGSWAGSARS